MNASPELSLAINQEMKRRGRMFQTRVQAKRPENVSAAEIKIPAHGDSGLMPAKVTCAGILSDESRPIAPFQGARRSHVTGFQTIGREEEGDRAV